MRGPSLFLILWVLGGFLLFRTGSANLCSPLCPPAFPLAVRNPYLSVWLPGNLTASLPSTSPKFWFGNDLTWSVIARVNGTAYSLFGVPSAPNGTKEAIVIGGNFTSTHSIFTLSAGSRNFTLDFLSPVSPKNLLRQSLPFAYLTVSVGQGLGDVQIYSDIDSSWTGIANNSTWNFTITGTESMYRLRPLNGSVFLQNAQEQALWGEAIYATRRNGSCTLSSASGPSSAIRSRFVQTGSLDNAHANWSADGVAGFAHDLGTANSGSSVTLAIGHFRDEVINYLGKTQIGYYRINYSDPVTTVSHFLDDYTEAMNESTRMDALIQKGGISSYGTNYSDILALSLRQIYGGIELVVPADSVRPDKAQAFIKELSSNGNVNTVDVIYATFPALYILSPNYIRLLLKPVFDYMASDKYTKPYAVHDLGTNYPNATGHDPNGQEMPIEESGNVIIMTYAYETSSGQNDLSTMYAALLKRYAQYLHENGRYPEKQLSLNDALGEMANQTNLAMKAASGLSLYGLMTRQENYTAYGQAIAEELYTKRLGTSPNGTYFKMQYENDIWFLAYNHYVDVLFRLGVFPAEAYNSTSTFYPTVRKPAGVALTGSIDWGQTNWQSYVAATVHGDAREMFIADLHAYISNGLNQAPFSDRYWVSNSSEGSVGHAFVFRARPTLGSHFALMALEGGNQWSSYDAVYDSGAV